MRVPATAPFPPRTFGVLLHPSSLPGRDLIGTVGAPAHQFLAWLSSTGAGIWQILPLTSTGRFDSPYFSASTWLGLSVTYHCRPMRACSTSSAQS